MKKNKLEDGKGLEPNPFPFSPSYASFLVLYKYNDYDGRINVLFVSSKKISVFRFGFPGGKEDSIDNGDIFETCKREYKEETKSETPDKMEPFFKVSRKNNEDDTKIFVNNFLVSFQEIQTKELTLQSKESIDGIGFKNLKEFDNLFLKQAHRLAFIEFCYWLEEHLGDEQSIKEDLSFCSYKMFERPSTVDNVFMWKHQNGTTEDSKKYISIFLKDPDLYKDLIIVENPKDKFFCEL